MARVLNAQSLAIEYKNNLNDKLGLFVGEYNNNNHQDNKDRIINNIINELELLLNKCIESSKLNDFACMNEYWKLLYTIISNNSIINNNINNGNINNLYTILNLSINTNTLSALFINKYFNYLLNEFNIIHDKITKIILGINDSNFTNLTNQFKLTRFYLLCMKPVILSYPTLFHQHITQFIHIYFSMQTQIQSLFNGELLVPNKSSILNQFISLICSAIGSILNKYLSFNDNILSSSIKLNILNLFIQETTKVSSLVRLSCLASILIECSVNENNHHLLAILRDNKIISTYTSYLIENCCECTQINKSCNNYYTNALIHLFQVLLTNNTDNNSSNLVSQAQTLLLVNLFHPHVYIQQIFTEILIDLFEKLNQNQNKFQNTIIQILVQLLSKANNSTNDVNIQQSICINVLVALFRYLSIAEQQNLLGLFDVTINVKEHINNYISPNSINLANTIITNNTNNQQINLFIQSLFWSRFNINDITNNTVPINNIIKNMFKLCIETFDLITNNITNKSANPLILSILVSILPVINTIICSVNLNELLNSQNSSVEYLEVLADKFTKLLSPTYFNNMISLCDNNSSVIEKLCINIIPPLTNVNIISNANLQQLLIIMQGFRNIVNVTNNTSPIIRILICDYLKSFVICKISSSEPQYNPIAQQLTHLFHLVLADYNNNSNNDSISMEYSKLCGLFTIYYFVKLQSCWSEHIQHFIPSNKQQTISTFMEKQAHSTNTNPIHTQFSSIISNAWNKIMTAIKHDGYTNISMDHDSIPNGNTNTGSVNPLHSINYVEINQLLQNARNLLVNSNNSNSNSTDNSNKMIIDSITRNLSQINAIWKNYNNNVSSIQ